MNSSNAATRFLRPLAWAGLLLALMALVATGIIGKGRGGGEPFADVKYWYVSTNMWLHGDDPYDHEHFRGRALEMGTGDINHYPYPPLAIWLGLGLQGSSYPTAKWTWVALNFLALIALIAAAARLLAILQRSSTRHAELPVPPVLVFAVLLLGSPYVANVLWTAQTALLSTAMLSWAWILIYDSRFPWLGGALLAMGAAKPQIALLLGVWLLIDRRWIALAGAAVFAMLLSAPAFYASGPGFITKWLRATDLYLAEPSQAILLSHNLNIKSLAISMGAEAGPLLTGIIVAACAAVLYFMRSRLASTAPDSVVAYSMLIPLSVLTLWGRDYDIAACSGLLLLGIHLTYLAPSRAFVLLPAIALLYVPHRFVEKLHIPLLTFWRPCLLAAGMVAFFIWYQRERKQALNPRAA